MKFMYQDRKLSGHLFLCWVLFWLLSTILVFDFGTVPTVRYILFYLLQINLIGTRFDWHIYHVLHVVNVKTKNVVNKLIKFK
jgi:hypothetical protein